MKRAKLSPDLKTPEKQNQVHSQFQKEVEQNLSEMNPLTCRESNPLQIDLVLETLFSFCPAKTLTNCRLVSKQWRDVSLKAWRNKAVLCPAKRTGDLFDLLSSLELVESEPKRNKPVKLKTSYPFRNFRLHIGNLPEYVKETANALSAITRKVILCDFNRDLVKIKRFLLKSPSLEVFEMKNCNWEKWSQDSPEPKVPFQSSNLKRFKIAQNITPSEIRAWEDLFERFGKLESLSIEYRASVDCLFDIFRILDALKYIKIAEGEAMPALNELEMIHVPQTNSKYDGDVPTIRNEDIIKSIVAYNFPLVNLTVHLLWRKADLKAEVLPIYHLMNSCKETLRCLKTSFIFNVSEETLKVHLQKREMNPYSLRMEALKEVYLGNGIWGMNILAGLDLPNLKKLVVENVECIKKMKNIKQVSLPLPKTVFGDLETLNFLDNRKVPGPKTIRAFAKIMPNLVNLTMPMDKFTFEAVCECFKGLKTLNALDAQCRYVEIDDESFTGICKGNGPGEPRRPNITDLALLTDLHIACDAGLQGNAYFTDLSATYGILQLPPLHALSIGFKELSDENMAKLESHVKGYLNIQVKGKFTPESYYDVEVDYGALGDSETGNDRS